MSLAKKSSGNACLAPETAAYTGDKKGTETGITLLEYSGEYFQERKLKTVDECFPLKDKPAITWINIDGIYDPEHLGKLGECFRLHPLVVEDILNTEQRPKVDDYGDYIFNCYIFIPHTFIVGLYGVNFKYMPELEWRYGYPAVLMLILATAPAMLFYFRKRKWL